MYMYVFQRANRSSGGGTGREKGREEEEEGEGLAEEEGEWVEYVDSFGRTRRCLKEDLPQMMAADERARER